MMGAEIQRGGETVGYLATLPSWQASLVSNMRLWFDGSPGRSEVFERYAHAFGENRGYAEVHGFEQFLTALATQGYRPIVRHAVGCKCLGADEAVFVRIVDLASGGELRDATALACLLVPPPTAGMIVPFAVRIGTTLKEWSPEQRPECPTRQPVAAMLH